MDKDFDYDKFVEFMQSMGGTFYSFNDDPTQNIINKLDALEEHVASRPAYSSADEMLNSIKGM